MLGHAPLASTPLADTEAPRNYTGTVAGLTLAATFSLAAGSYASPGAPAYSGTVAGLTLASSLSIAAGTYSANVDTPLAAPVFVRRITWSSIRRIGDSSL